MFNLGPKQSRYALIIALLLYVATMTGLFAWLAFKGEETVQTRLEKTPSVTVTLAGKEPPVPASWKEQTPPTPEPVAMPPAKTQEPTPELPAGQTPIPPAKTETPAAAIPPVKTPEPAATATPPVPAVETAAQTPIPEVTATPQPAQPTVQLTWQRYARPFDQANTKPRISIIIADLGLAAIATQTAVQELPGEVSLAFSSSAPDLEAWIAKSRAAGHENILTIPMEPDNYPQNDPGPNTLLTGLEGKENVSRMRWALARSDGYVGVMPYMGQKFTTVEEKLAPIMDVVKDQGLMIIDDTMNKNSMIAPLSRLGKIPFTRSDAVIDLAASRTAIDAQLAELERLAKEKGHAVGVALPYPVTFEKLKAWIPTLEAKGFVLAPITAVASVDIPAPAVDATATPVAGTTTPAAPTPEPSAAQLTAPSATPAAPVAPAPPTKPVMPDPNRINNPIVQ